MNTFVLTEDNAMLRELAQSLAGAEIRSRSEEVDHNAVFPLAGMRVLAEAGLVCCMLPEEYGGAALDYWSQLCVVEETAKECASTAWALANTAEAAECLLRAGTEEQKQKYLPVLIDGSCAVAAGAGKAADAGALRAEPAGAGYVLTGSRKQVPGAAECSLYLVEAVLAEKNAWFVVKSGAAGLAVQNGSALLGMKGCPVGTLVFDRCEVPAVSLLQADISALRKDIGTLYMAAIAAGIAQRALHDAIQYVNQRVRFGKTIAQFENTRQKMAQMLASAEAARALVWDAARVKDSGQPYGYAAAMAKSVSSNTASMVTRKCVQFMGGYGYSREYPVERKMRDAKMTALIGRTNEDCEFAIAAAAVLQ